MGVVVLRRAFLAWWTVAVSLFLLGAAVHRDEDPSSPDFAFPSRVRHCCNAAEQGNGGICPWDNTCCRIVLDDAATVQQLNSDADSDPGGTITSRSAACIPSDLGARVATCCYDDDDDQFEESGEVATTSLRTGCGVGYRCGSSPSNSSQRSCLADPSIIQDPLVQVLPRYHLCQFNEQSADFSKVWGLSSPAFFGNNGTSMPYYSSHGSLERLSNDEAARDNIRMVLITVHGANRNADDYFCCAHAAVQLAIQQQQQQQNEIALPFESINQVLVLAPRFMVRSDFPKPRLASRYLYWEDTPNGPWRYGASAIQESRNNNGTDVSSFQVLDAFLDYILGNSNNFPNLQHVALAGHSSGGQMVQRWALLSPHVDDKLRLVVANPSSYSYLSPLRYNATAHRWAVPATVASCPGYNQWEWGLDTDANTPRYVQKVLDDFATNSSSNDQHPYQSLIDRFVTTRRAIYLHGSQDRCNVSSTATTTASSSSSSSSSTASSGSDIEATVQNEPWCESHGLETTCADQLQGSNRFERSERYMEMLDRIMLDTPRATETAATRGYHRRVVVPGVGHDHSLMFASSEGLRALFSLDDEDDDFSDALAQNTIGSLAEHMRNFVLSMKWKFLICSRY